MQKLHRRPIDDVESPAIEQMEQAGSPAATRLNTSAGRKKTHVLIVLILLILSNSTHVVRWRRDK
jgi:hypothetical protein